MRRRRPFTEEDTQTMLTLRMAGTHPRDIALAVNRTERTVHHKLSLLRNGLGLRFPPLKHASLKYDRTVVEAWCARIDSGATQASIAAALGVTPAFISRKIAAFREGRLL